MEEILAITNLFVVEPTPRIREELFSVIATVNANALKRPLQDWVIKALKNFPTSDVVICDVTVGGNDPVSFRSGDWDSVAAALETLDELQRAAGPVAPCEVVLRIEKKLKANSISLYSIAALHAGLSGLGLKSLFSLFSKLLEANSEIVFRCLEPGLDFRTRTLHFTSAIDSQSATHGDRSKILERRSELCHFENAAEMKVLPSDFHLEKRSTKTEWDSLFDRLCTVLSIVYLSDVAFFRGENTVQFKLKGYKTLSGEIKWEEVTADAAEILFKVFEWVYEGGVAHDNM